MIDPQVLAKRVFWLAFQASEHMELDKLHIPQAMEMTEDRLFADYVAPATSGKPGCGYIGVDYVVGRMMKTVIEWSPEGVRINPDPPRPDYQSWSKIYPSADELRSCAFATLTPPLA